MTLTCYIYMEVMLAMFTPPGLYSGEDISDTSGV